MARDELAATLGVAAPPRVTLRFHPTTADFERATGRPWFTSGSLGRQRAAPAAAGRYCANAALLDRTIRHELVHALADKVLEERPAWVREGAAIYFAEEPNPGGTGGPGRRPAPRAACPRDNELLQPVSAGR